MANDDKEISAKEWALVELLGVEAGGKWDTEKVIDRLIDLIDRLEAMKTRQPH